MAFFIEQFMKKLIIILLLSLVQPSILDAQISCANPIQVDLCPSVYLTHQTNAGAQDDAPSACNISGEDLVYEIFAPQSALHIYISVMNATGAMKLTLNTGSCTAATCNTYNILPGNSTIAFNVSSANYYYLWVDASSTVEYDISIGGDTSLQAVSVPNTQGLLAFDHCAIYPFKISKPFFEVKYNNTFKYLPMTLSPLNQTGQLCVSVYLKNLSGVSGARVFQFSFNPAGFAGIVPADTLFSGFYNTGDWKSVSTGFNQQFIFYDSLGLGRGDFDGNPNVCLKYEFCFDLIPLSNDPNLTDVAVNIYSDDYGAGFNGIVGQGCCPFGFSNCLYRSGTSSGGQAGLSFGFNDPGSGLPIELIDFDGAYSNGEVKLNWTTATEINNDFFTVERSKSGFEWIELLNIGGAGTSSVMNTYSSIDIHPLKGISYYRLKQTDFDGHISRSEPIKISNISERIQIYPNPVSEKIFINLPRDNEYQLFLYSGIGETMLHQTSIGITNFDVSVLPEGVYFLQIYSGNESIEFKKIIIMHNKK